MLDSLVGDRPHGLADRRIAIASLPTIIAHTAEVKIQPYALSSYDVQIGEFAWK